MHDFMMYIVISAVDLQSKSLQSDHNRWHDSIKQLDIHVVNTLIDILDV